MTSSEHVGPTHALAEAHNIDPARPMEVFMREARRFFGDEFGLAFDSKNQLTERPSTEQLDRLQVWREATFPDGIEMPDTETFARKVLLAQALMPQRDEKGRPTYLMGKGIGLEIAVQGEVRGRQKRTESPRYRTHSDFEIYGFDEKNPPAGYGDFHHVFGGQEFFPTSKTKGLHELPENYLHDTSEEVNLGGVLVLVPGLEAQFVDKTEKANVKGERELRGMTDAEALARTYTIDSQEVHQLIQSHVIEPALKVFNPQRQVQRLRKNALLMGEDNLKNAGIAIGPANTVVLAEYGIDPVQLIHQNEAEAKGVLQEVAQQALDSKHQQADAILAAPA